MYYFDVWVDDQDGQEAILGIEFIAPAGIRLYLSGGTLVLPDEVRIHLEGRRRLYGSSMQPIVVPEQYVVRPVGRPTEIRIGNNPLNARLRGGGDSTCVPTVPPE